MSGAVLIVEDDHNLRLTLEDNLAEEGYQVSSAATAAEAWAQLCGRPYEVVVLDIMLPDGDGYSLCRRIRQEGLGCRVLMLTARTLEDDLVKGFEAGADDYLGKPYRLRELLARVNSLSRRGGVGPAPEVLRFAGFELNLGKRTLADGEGKLIELTKTEFDLLHCLLRSRDRVLTRDEILDQVWGKEVVVDSHTVDNFVSSLKRKLGWQPRSRFHIRTVRGVGYRLELDE
ncbi:MAG: response regulator transcription factor [Myxococcales bacterium]|nr:response regulator transcription factor [Myxococcales bacterium]